MRSNEKLILLEVIFSYSDTFHGTGVLLACLFYKIYAFFLYLNILFYKCCPISILLPLLPNSLQSLLHFPQNFLIYELPQLFL